MEVPYVLSPSLLIILFFYICVSLAMILQFFYKNTHMNIFLIKEIDLLKNCYAIDNFYI